MPVSRALSIVKQLSGGLGEAHAQGVVHRDLKPANIMVDGNGTVKIMDFGIARMMETEAGQTATIVGTPAYMSPEQAEGKPVDARSDIYAIGLIFYEMLTGRATFSGDTVVAIAMKQVTEAPNLPRDLVPIIPEQIERVILKCLEKVPAKRFQSVSEFAHALETCTNTSRRAPSLSSTRNIWISERLMEIERYVSGMQVGKTIDQGILALSTLSKPMPKHLSLGKRQVETRHALVLASLIFLVPLAWSVLGHSKPTSPVTTKPPSSPSLSEASKTPNSFTSIPRIPYPGSSVGASASLGDLDSVATTAKPDVNNVDDYELEPSEVPAQIRHGKSLPHSLANTPKSQRSAQTTAASSLPLPSTVASPGSPTPLLASVPNETSDNPSASRNDGSVSAPAPNPINPATDKYFEVGSFKESKWADNASETLERLGFHTTSLHKGRLWMNSYHVIVGPYHDDDTAEAARHELELHGFKPRITKID